MGTVLEGSKEQRKIKEHKSKADESLLMFINVNVVALTVFWF